MENKIQEQAIDLIEHKTSLLKKIFCILLAIVIVVGGVFLFIEFKNGKFSDVESFQTFVQSFGWWGPIILTLFQCVKVVYAVIPGTIGYIVGPSLFGTILGILCNYIGICAGSFIAFWLSRKFGVTIMKQVFSEKKYQKCIRWMEKWHKSYPVFLWIAILIPISPDDFLCYFTGLTEMKFKKFAIIILTSKPWFIIVYGLIFGNIFN
ncbi:MAG: TVP38/TMEM64 family protein [Treponema sp.]|nr:TVP38/TMEM64 family protein [Candidatus Treponema equifaecale]